MVNLLLTFKKEVFRPQIMGVQWVAREMQPRNIVNVWVLSRASLPSPLVDTPDRGRGSTGCASDPPHWMWLDCYPSEVGNSIYVEVLNRWAQIRLLYQDVYNIAIILM